MNYSELKKIFQELKRTSPRENLTAHIIFTEDSFDRPYPLLSRTYLVSSDNKGFYPHMFSNSIFAYCLDVTSDQGVRLDWLMAEEGNPGGWKVEDCYILEKMRDAEAICDLTRIELEEDTICYGFGSSSTCIRVLETNEGGKIRLEPLAGNQMVDGKWVDLTIDRICGYCTLLEQQLSKEAG
ncbi:MAG: hypothetical protein HDT14_02040 [Oscillibacter sp.]|nr:hypothetical protein [Oscillibacter sp.]